jgi:lipopolysaccharide/colanic/teichoic acid biosynthesis glycosyltransferase
VARAIKRIIDLVLALIMLILLMPLMAAISTAIMCESRGGPLFRQKRAGRKGRPFTVNKFRSMRQGEPGIGHATGIRDPRITPIGAFLRRTSLDELPQLFNVVAGDMSLVGPRPLLTTSTRPSEVVRLEMRPGITGLAAVSGRQALSWDERMALDCRYVENWSLSLDIRILLKTIPVALSQENVYDRDGEAKARP